MRVNCLAQDPREGGGGVVVGVGYYQKSWLGVCSLHILPTTLTLFKTKICDESELPCTRSQGGGGGGGGGGVLPEKLVGGVQPTYTSQNLYPI